MLHKHSSQITADPYNNMKIHRQKHSLPKTEPPNDLTNKQIPIPQILKKISRD